MSLLNICFFSCPLVQSGLSGIQSSLFQASPLAPAFTVIHALFRFSSDELRCVPKIFCYLLNVCKSAVWRQRNDFRFCNVAPGVAQLIACIRARLRFYRPLSFKRFSSAGRRGFFLRQRGANGVLSSVCVPRFYLWILSTSFGENLYANMSLLRNRKFDLIGQSGWVVFQPNHDTAWKV